MSTVEHDLEVQPVSGHAAAAGPVSVRR